MTAPATTRPFRERRGSEPGAAILARAERTWCRHWRRSNAAGEVGKRPPLPVSIAYIRRDHARPPTTRPSGIAAGAMVTAASSGDPARASRQAASQARYGAAATGCHAPAAAAVAASHTATIGRLHRAARYSRPGGRPARHAATTVPVATRETGAAAMISAATRPILISFAATRTSASTASRPRYRRITGPLRSQRGLLAAAAGHGAARLRAQPAGRPGAARGPP